MTLRSRPLLRALLVPAAILGVMILAGCGGPPVASNRHMQPLSERMLAELKAKKMEKESPILMRIFKEESELEVWKQNDSGRFALLRNYPICRWSGELGPKFQAGDRQAPEGFYTITPDLMNPNSSQYLAINTGFPNAYDRVNGRTGSFLMIHGGCSSSGCYAMTDEQIAEIYALARELVFWGPGLIPTASLSLSHDPAQHGPPSQLAAYSVLENDQGGLRSFRGFAPGAPGRRMREALPFRDEDHMRATIAPISRDN